MAKKKFAEPFMICAAIEVPTKQCEVWAGNVNYGSEPDELADKMLAAMIKQLGVLNPLIGFVDKKKTMIVAGRRRLEAARAVKKPTVPVRLVEVDLEQLKDKAKVDQLMLEISLAENLARVQMGPFVEAEAFTTAARVGKIKDVARTFGVTEHYVKQRMQLTNLIQDARDVYLNEGPDQVPMEVLQKMSAYPQETQQEWWDRGYKNGHSWWFSSLSYFRGQFINPVYIDSEDAKFDLKDVPEEAWEPQDLFSDPDAPRRIRSDVFKVMQRGALIAEAERLKKEGWSDVQVIDRDQDELPSGFWHNQIEPEYVETDREKQVRARMNEIDEIDMDDETVDQDALLAEYGDLEDELGKIQSKQEGVFDDETRAGGKAIVVMEPNGRSETYYYRDPETSTSSSRANGVAGQDAEETTQSAQFKDTAQQEQILSRAIELAIIRRVMEDERVGLAIMITRMATIQYSLGDGKIGSYHAGDSLQRFRREFKETKFAANFPNRREILEWMEDGEFGGEADQVFNHCMTLEVNDLVHLIAVLSVRALDCRPHADRSLMQVIAPDIRRDFRPNDLFLAGYTKADLYNLLTQFDWAEGHKASDKKPELLEAGRSMFAGDDLAIGAWLPPSMEHFIPLAEDEDPAGDIVVEDQDGAEAIA